MHYNGITTFFGIIYIKTLSRNHKTL